MYEKIRQDIKFAMKNGDKFKMNLLKCVWSDIQKIQKDNNGIITGVQVVDIVKKYIKSANENIKETGKNPQKALNTTEAYMEIKILEKYLPEQLTENEMKTIIEKQKDKKFGEIMKLFKDNYPNQYDGKTLAKLVKMAQ